MESKNEEKVAVKMNNCSDVTMTNVKFVGYDKAINATNVDGINVVDSKMIVPSIKREKLAWYKKSENIIALIIGIVTIAIMLVLG